MRNISLIVSIILVIANIIYLIYISNKIHDLKSQKKAVYEAYSNTLKDLYDCRLREKELDAVKLEDLTNDAIFVPLTSERYSDLVKKELELIELKLKLKGLDNEKQND